MRRRIVRATERPRVSNTSAQVHPHAVRTSGCTIDVASDQFERTVKKSRL